jgi:hypothetical protein
MARIHGTVCWLLSSLGLALLVCGLVMVPNDSTFAQTTGTCSQANGECSVYTVKADCDIAGRCGEASLNCKCKWGTSCTCAPQ